MAESKKNTQVASIDQNDSDEFQSQWRMEIHEWVESLEAVKESYSDREVKELLRELQNYALSHGISLTEATLIHPIGTPFHSRSNPVIRVILKWKQK